MTQRQIVVIEGDGIGPEVVHAMHRVVNAVTGNAIEWVPAPAGLTCYEDTGESLPSETVTLLQECGLGIKGPTTTPGGGGFRSVNVRLREQLKLFVGHRPAVSYPGVPTLFEGVHLDIFRHNIGDLYGAEEEITDGELGRIVTLTATFDEDSFLMLCRYAFAHAARTGKRRVTLVTKKNILKVSGRVYSEVFEEIARSYPQIQADHMLVDAMAAAIVRGARGFEVLVTTNLFGDILSDAAGALVGGIGVAAGANIGERVALFEAVHGSAPDIAGQGIANPTALMFSAVMMLRHAEFVQEADQLEAAITACLASGERTGDLGGHLNTQGFTQAVLARL